MPKSVIKQAYQLYRRRKFADTIRLLESQVFRFRDSDHFYFLLGSACLYSGDFGGAESYLKRSEQLRPDSVETLLGLAVVYLRRLDTDEALKKWLAVIDRAPRDPRAQRGLDFLRQGPASEKIAELVDTGKVKKLYPSLPFNPRQAVIPLLSLAITGFLVFSFIFLLPRLPRKQIRPGIKEIVLSMNTPAISGNPVDNSLKLSEEEINATFERIKEYLLAYRDNLAIREINRIMLSNASAYVKEKAALLKTFVGTPDFSTIKDPFAYTDVLLQPALYRDSYVVWSGKTANTVIGEKSMQFDLLVGYHDEKALLGIVPVSFEFAIEVDNGQSVEVLGRVVFVEDRFSLEGTSIHPLLIK